MNRTEVLSRLNGVVIKCNEFVEELHEDFKDTETWLEHLRRSVKNIVEDGVFVIPKTPAGVRKKRRLSVIKEFDSGEPSHRPSYGVSKTSSVLFDDPRVVTRSIGRIAGVVEDRETFSENKVSDKRSLCGLKPFKIAVKRLSKNSKARDKLSLNGRSKRVTRSTRSIKKGCRAVTDVKLDCVNEDNSHDVESDCVESSVNRCQEERVDKLSVKYRENAEEKENASPSEFKGSGKLKSHVCETQKVKNGNSSDHVGKENSVNYIHTSSNVLLVPGSKGEQVNPVCVESNVENNTEVNVNSVGDSKNSNVSSAYYSMVTEESPEENRSSYLTAASLQETSCLQLSDRHKITEEQEASGDLQQDNILKENVQGTFKSPMRIMKSPQLFCPYSNESVKKRVAAYEGLTALNNGDILKTHKRVTRSKARALFAKEQEVKKNNSKRKSTTQKQIKSVSRAVKNLPVKNDTGKENSFVYSAKKAHLSSASNILSDVNVLSTSRLNSAKKMPLTGQNGFANVASTSLVNKTVSTAANMVLGSEIWIKKAPKSTQNTEMKKLEELKKREEKEREVQQRREELLKKRAQELRKKEEKRLLVMLNKEAQDKEKQESKLRVGRERDEKLNMLLHEREAKQKEEILKKKLETEKKATEARRKFEEAETARVAKLKTDEKLAEETEREHKRRVVDEKEKTVLKEKNNIKPNKVPELILKNCVEENAVLDSQLDGMFSIPNNDLKLKAMDNAHPINNICNLEDLMSGSDLDDSDDENQSQTAPWAKRQLLNWQSRLEVNVMYRVKKVFASNNISDILSLFPNKRLQRSSSARWDTPPRYSTLPLY